MTAVVVVGLLLLVGPSVAVGMAVGHERNTREHHRLAAARRQLRRWEQELLAAVDVDGCASCALLRRRAEPYRSPTDLVHD